MLTDVEEHGHENNETEPLVKHTDEEYDGHDDIDDGRQNREENVIEQIIDRVCASVHDPQYFARFSA